MPADLTPIIAATAQWLVRAYPSTRGTFHATLAQMQARQATTVAAWLRYPTAADAALVTMIGPGGSERLDWLLGPHTPVVAHDDYAWRTWVDEVVASWAACLLTEPALAAAAVAALNRSEHTSGQAYEFRRLTEPDENDRNGTALLRHPDLLAPLAALHRTQLVAYLQPTIRDAA